MVETGGFWGGDIAAVDGGEDVIDIHGQGRGLLSQWAAWRWLNGGNRERRRDAKRSGTKAERNAASGQDSVPYGAHSRVGQMITILGPVGQDSSSLFIPTKENYLLTQYPPQVVPLYASDVPTARSYVCMYSRMDRPVRSSIRIAADEASRRSCHARDYRLQTSRASICTAYGEL